AAAREGRMGDIVATIQAEQDEIIRSDVDGILVVEGGPGTGKTAVALHRAAYLLYTHRERLERSGVLVVGPSRVFLRYIEQVRPSPPPPLPAPAGTRRRPPRPHPPRPTRRAAGAGPAPRRCAGPRRPPPPESTCRPRGRPRAPLTCGPGAARGRTTWSRAPTPP